MVVGTESDRHHTGVCNSSRRPGLEVVLQKHWEAVGVAMAALTAQLPDWSWQAQLMHWRTEVVEVAAAGPCRSELDLLAAGQSFLTVLVWVDFLDLEVLGMLLGACVREKPVAEKAPARAGLFLGHTGPGHLLLPAGRNGLGYVAQTQIVWDDWLKPAEKLCHLSGMGEMFSQDFPKSYLM